MAAGAKHPPAVFARAAFARFRFLARELDPSGGVTLRYALDDLEFTERIVLPMPAMPDPPRRASLEGLLSLLHWGAGRSHFKAAPPPPIRREAGPPRPAAPPRPRALDS